MTNAELEAFLDRWVTVVFVSGQVQTGRLVRRVEAIVLNQPYALEWFEKTHTLGVLEQRWQGIPDASVVQSVNPAEPPGAGPDLR